VSKGKRGAIPDWYPYFIAAEECHCSPWQLLGWTEVSPKWKDWALIKRAAENEAREEIEKRNQSRQRGLA
jgi:hypothetical protein